MAQTKRSNGTRRLSGNRKARYTAYKYSQPWLERRVKRMMRDYGLTRAVAEGCVRDKKPVPKGTRRIVKKKVA